MKDSEAYNELVKSVTAIVFKNLTKAKKSAKTLDVAESQVKAMLQVIPDEGLSILSSGGLIQGKGINELTEAITKNIASGFDLDKFNATVARDFIPTKDDIILNNVLNNTRLERKKELGALKVSEKDKTTETLYKHFEDRAVATTEDFESSGKKEAGLSAGYQATRKSDTQMEKQKFMLKHGVRKMEHLPEEDSLWKEDREKRARQIIDRRDLVGEYVMAPLYNRLLFDRAPIIELVNSQGELIKSESTGIVTVKPDKSNKDIYIRSKFMDATFQMLGNFSGNPDPKGYYIDAKSPKLKEVEGFEKVMAACFMLGELDYHAGNIGVVEKKDESGKVHYIAVKIDHGKSAIVGYSNERALREGMINRFRLFGYSNKNGDMVLPFSALKLKESIDEMLKISKDEIANLIGSRFDLLQKAGFDLKGMNFLSEENGYTTPTEFKNLDKAKQLYIDRLIKRIAVMQEFSNTLDIVAKSDAPDFIKEGDWVNELGTLDPIEWAIKSKFKIEGLDPVIWAIRNGYKIKSLDPEVWIKHKSYPIDKSAVADAKKYRLQELEQKIIKAIDDIDQNTYPQLRQRAQDDINKLVEEHKALRKGLVVPYELGEQSEVYKLLMSGNEKTVARLIDNISAASRVKGLDNIAINLQAIMKNSPPELWIKMHEVGQKVASRHGGEVNGFKDGLNKFANGVKRVFSFGSAGVADKKIKDAVIEFEKISKAKAAEINLAADKTNKVPGKMKSFVDSLALKSSDKGRGGKS